MDNNPLKNLFAVPDLRNRILFTLGLLGVYRIGNHVTTPGVNQDALLLLADQTKNTMFGLYDMFSGQNLSKVTIFALGVMPYISSSIILQLLTVVWPYLERISKEGELGRRKITQWTRYLTVILAILQSLGMATGLQAMSDGMVVPVLGGVAAVCAFVGSALEMAAAAPSRMSARQKVSSRCMTFLPSVVD